LEVTVRRSGAERWRWQAKAALASAIAWSATRSLSRLLADTTRHRPLVLGYHRVVDDFAAASRADMPAMLTSRAMFERHLDWLGRHFRFVTLDEVGAHVANGVPFSEPVVAITFDDGYRDVYEHAFPILKRKGIPAAMFVVTSLVGRQDWQVHDKLYQVVAKAFATWDDPRRELLGALTHVGVAGAEILRDRAAFRNPTVVTATLLPNLSHAEVDRVIHGLEANLGYETNPIPPTVDWNEIQTMRRYGFTIGSHTETHVSLPMESSEKIAAELVCSKLAIERRLGERVAHFAYPGGHFTTAIVDAIASAGYDYAYTACPHGDVKRPQLTIERLLLWEGASADADGLFSADIFACQARRLWPAFKCDRVHHA
jgi:peptidoglycan/xylan/chitin deacetylase (PgdA/CDA1 family)